MVIEKNMMVLVVGVYYVDMNNVQKKQKNYLIVNDIIPNKSIGNSNRYV